MICNAIDRLIAYGINTGLVESIDGIYVRNLLLEAMNETDYSSTDASGSDKLADILKELTDIAVSKGLISDSTESRDIFDTKLMNCLTPRPAEVRERFSEKLSENTQAATDWFYKFSCDTNYIRRDRIAKDRKWTYDSKYGTIDITINLSKPEKDPRDIAAAGRSASSSYPKCQLCLENEGYSGRIGHPARANHRVIPLTLNGQSWSFQYSPYVYYNEHCIVFNNEHVPMKIDRAAFEKLFDFVGLFPHYFVGSNADLPIVGGSILSHEHFQGGHYTFAMERAEIEHEFSIQGYEDILCGIVNWPLSVIRLRSKDPSRLADLSEMILNKWRRYTDEKAVIIAETDGTPHNTITPIARRRGDDFEIDLCLRNNITTEEHPLGLYHPHAERHHIKKENIGLIEVMGLAVLPARLNRELDALEECIANGSDPLSNTLTASHAEWAAQFISELAGCDRKAVRQRLQLEVGRVFEQVLEDAGVFKRDYDGKQAFLRFIESL